MTGVGVVEESEVEAGLIDEMDEFDDVDSGDLSKGSDEIALIALEVDEEIEPEEGEGTEEETVARGAGGLMGKSMRVFEDFETSILVVLLVSGQILEAK